MLTQKGMLATVGCAMRNHRYEEDSLNFSYLTEAGAIPLVRGSTPIGALTIHTTNFIWGRAQNVYDRSRSCGGSSGGDAGLVAAKCVPFAIGSDVGGSIRIPSHFLGITGFKPSHIRASCKGMMAGTLEGRFPDGDHLRAVSGPIGQSVRDCNEIFKL